MWQVSGNCLHTRHPVYGLARATEPEASFTCFCFLKMRLKQFEGEFFHFSAHKSAHRKHEGQQQQGSKKNNHQPSCLSPHTEWGTKVIGESFSK